MLINCIKIKKAEHPPQIDSNYYYFYLLTKDSNETCKKFFNEFKNIIHQQLHELKEISTSNCAFETVDDNICWQKNWSRIEKQKIKQTPGLLIIEVNLPEFNPRLNPWLHISFNQMPTMLQQQIQKVEEIASHNARNDKMEKENNKNLKDLISLILFIASKHENIFDLIDHVMHRWEMKEKFDLGEIKMGMFGFSFHFDFALDFFQYLHQNLQHR